MIPTVERRLQLVRGDRPRHSADHPVVGGADAVVVRAADGGEVAGVEQVGVVVGLPPEETPHETVVEVVPHPGRPWPWHGVACAREREISCAAERR